MDVHAICGLHVVINYIFFERPIAAYISVQVLYNDDCDVASNHIITQAQISMHRPCKSYFVWICTAVHTAAGCATTHES